MHLLIAPISGGAFPVQLGFIVELYQARQCIGTRYDAILASSGGNVATYIGLAGDFTDEGIERICHRLHPSLFLSSWWPWALASILPSWILGYYEGTIFNRGSGCEGLFEDVFTPASISRVEIWTGTLNRTTGKAEMFTNMPAGESSLDVSRFQPDKFNAMPLHYVGPDRRILGQVTYASAAIPVLIPSVDINASNYADGGTCFSSPLTPLQDCIPVQGCLHLDYLSSYDLESNTTPTTYRNLFENGSEALAEVVKSLGIQDRLSGIALLRGPIMFETGICTSDILAMLVTRRQGYYQSFLELYPRCEMEIRLDAFTPRQIIDAMAKARQSMMYRLWWVASSISGSNGV